jgi:hypothetical protein
MLEHEPTAVACTANIQRFLVLRTTQALTLKVLHSFTTQQIHEDLAQPASVKLIIGTHDRFQSQCVTILFVDLNAYINTSSPVS